MAQAAGSVASPPLFCIVNAVLNYSVDGGATWNPYSPAAPALATGTVDGLMPHNNMAQLGYVGPLLTDANTTRNPETDKASVYVLPANTLTQNRAFTFDEAGALFNGTVMWAVIHPQSFIAEIASLANGTIYQVQPGAITLVVGLYKGGAGYQLWIGFYGYN